MKKRLYKILFAGVFLVLVSSCTSMKPFFEVGTVTGEKSISARGYTVKSGFHPSSGVFNDSNADLFSVQKDRKWKASASFPAKIRLEF